MHPVRRATRIEQPLVGGTRAHLAAAQDDGSLLLLLLLLLSLALSLPILLVLLVLLSPLVPLGPLAFCFGHGITLSADARRGAALCAVSTARHWAISRRFIGVSDRGWADVDA